MQKNVELILKSKSSNRQDIEMAANDAIRIFTEAEVAHILRCSKETIARQRKRGLIGHFKVGRKIFITLEQLNAYIAQGSVAPCQDDADKIGSGFTAAQRSHFGQSIGMTQPAVGPDAQAQVNDIVRKHRSGLRNTS